MLSVSRLANFVTDLPHGPCHYPEWLRSEKGRGGLHGILTATVLAVVTRAERGIAENGKTVGKIERKPDSGGSVRSIYLQTLPFARSDPDTVNTVPPSAMRLFR